MSKLFKKTIIVTALTTALAACGGGGDSEAPATNPGGTTATTTTAPTTTLTFNLSESSLTIDELTKKDIDVTVNYSGSSNLTYSYDVKTVNSDSYSDISITGNKITVNANDVDQNVTYDVDITLSDGTVTHMESFSVEVMNKPDDSIIAQAELWGNGNTLFAMIEFDEMLDIYLKAAYFSKGIQKSEIEIFEQKYNDLKTSILENSNSELMTSLQSYIVNYSAGIESGAALLNKVNLVQELAKDNANSLIAILNELSDISSGALPKLSVDKLKYIERYSAFSSIIGNESMGSFTDDVWRFSGEFEFMNTLVSKLGNTTDCSAN
jgi:hypothetical protein